MTFPAAGEYYITVQGYDETQLGSYTVAARTVGGPSGGGGGGRGAGGGRGGGGPDFCSGGAPIELVRSALGAWSLEWSRGQAVRGRKQFLRGTRPPDIAAYQTAAYQTRPPDTARPPFRTGRTASSRSPTATTPT